MSEFIMELNMYFFTKPSFSEMRGLSLHDQHGTNMPLSNFFLIIDVVMIMIRILPESHLPGRKLLINF